MSRTRGSKNKPKIKTMTPEENAEMAKKVQENELKENSAVA